MNIWEKSNVGVKRRLPYFIRPYDMGCEIDLCNFSLSL